MRRGRKAVTRHRSSCGAAPTIEKTEGNASFIPLALITNSRCVVLGPNSNERCGLTFPSSVASRSNHLSWSTSKLKSSGSCSRNHFQNPSFAEFEIIRGSRIPSIQAVSRFRSGDRGSNELAFYSLGEHLLDAAQRLTRAFLILDQSKAHVAVAVVAEADSRRNSGLGLVEQQL